MMYVLSLCDLSLFKLESSFFEGYKDKLVAPLLLHLIFRRIITEKSQIALKDCHA